METAKKYSNPDMVAKMIAVDTQLTQKFDTINSERYRCYNMLVPPLQWPEKDRAKLQKEGRPVHSYPLINPIIRNISGYEKGGRKNLSIIGRSAGDYDKAVLMNKVHDFYLKKTDWDAVKSRAFLDAIIARWTFIYQNWSFQDDPEGMLELKAYNPFRIKFDMDFSDPMLKDCKYLEDSAWYSLEEILQMFAFKKEDGELRGIITEKAEGFFAKDPNIKKSIVGTMLSRVNDAVGSFFKYSSRDSYNPATMQNSSEWFDPSTSRFKVTELHERRLVNKVHLYDYSKNERYDLSNVTQRVDGGTGFDEEKIRYYKSLYPDSEVSQVQIREIWITTAIPAFDLMIRDEPYAIQNNNFLYVPVWGYDFHPDKMKAQSVVDELIDPQMDYNKRRSTILEILSKFSTQGYVVEEGAIDGFEDEWTNKKIGGIRRIAKNMIDKFKVDQLPNIAPELIRDTQEAKLNIEEISSVPKAAQGRQESSQETGKLFNAKREQAEVMLQYLFDNLDQSAMQIGRNNIDLLQHYCTEERAIRITTDTGEQEDLVINQRVFGEIKNDITTGKFDLEIDETPYGRTARQLEFAKLFDMYQVVIQTNPQLAMILLPIVIEASDSPYKTKILQAIQSFNQQQQLAQQQAAQANIPPQQDLVEKKMQMQNAMLDLNSKHLDNVKKERELQDSQNEQEIMARVNEILGGGRKTSPPKTGPGIEG